MINFIFNTNKYDKIGIKYRYKDFITFLDDYKIDYSISNVLQEKTFNIIDLFYLCDNPNFQINDSCYIFCGSSKKIFEAASYYKEHNMTPNYHQYISHNLYYAQCFDGVFLPMYLYLNDIVLRDTGKQYKYGIFANSYDVSYLMFDEVINTLGIDWHDILFMDNYGCVSHGMNVTNNKNIFYSSIETFLDFTNDYTNRHVMSRTYLELIANNIPIQIVSFNKSKPVSFKGFSHVQYEIVIQHKLFDLLNVYYEPKYFKTDTYLDYIKYIFNKLDTPIRLKTVEEYCNNG